jgi:hypothetical protein
VDIYTFIHTHTHATQRTREHDAVGSVLLLPLGVLLLLLGQHGGRINLAVAGHEFVNHLVLALVLLPLGLWSGVWLV